MVGGTTIAFLGGLHFWWPKMTGRMYPDNWGKTSAVLVFVGFNLTFFPQFILGYLGMPRRYAYYDLAPEWQIWHVMSTLGASVLALGFALPAFYLTWSLRYGKKAGKNPWHAKGLEWETESPPDTHNFHHQPIVTYDAYDYDTEAEEREVEEEEREIELVKAKHGDEW
jgi:cytochrome c oxidase subunit 1